MMITHIVGNRPQFIKLAPLFHELNKRGYSQNIIHTGQHYDANMSDIFFDELGIPEPEINLGIGSGTHAEMTARAMIGIEKNLVEKKPELVVLYGDTDTTAAAALAVCKLDLPLAHVEGGARYYSRQSPEDINRKVTDHVSDIIFAPDEYSYECAQKEGLGEITFFSGDIMYDVFLNKEKDLESGRITDPFSHMNDFVLLTWHRQENTQNKEKMERILSFLEKIDDQIICPMHPRTVRCLNQFHLLKRAQNIRNLKIIEPIGYLEMVSLMQKAKYVVTDSGGVSKESSFAGAKCLIMLDFEIWPVLSKCKWTSYIDFEDDISIQNGLDNILNAKRVEKKDRPHCFGDGNAAVKMVDLLIDRKFI